MSKKFEYQLIEADEYDLYKAKADHLLSQIAIQSNKLIIDLTYMDVIEYFEYHYSLHFIFFGYDVFDIRPCGPANNSNIYYKDLVKNQSFIFVNEEFCQRCSGMTLPDKSGRITIMINQQDVPLQRIIFTLLHELSHVYCHLSDSKTRSAFISLSGESVCENYPSKLIPFENEANTVASILYTPDIYLQNALISKKTFYQIKEDRNLSDSALHNRLMNYLLYNLKIPHGYALGLVLNYRNEEHKDESTAKLTQVVTNKLLSRQEMIAEDLTPYDYVPAEYSDYYH